MTPPSSQFIDLKQYSELSNGQISKVIQSLIHTFSSQGIKIYKQESKLIIKTTQPEQCMILGQVKYAGIQQLEAAFTSASLEDLPVEDPMYQEITSLFDKTSNNKQVVKIQFLKNVALQSTFMKELGNIKLLFHGCQTEAVRDIIVNTGFDIKFARQGLHGWGLYFALDSSYSQNYSCTHNDGTKGMFLAEVAAGKTFDATNGATNGFFVAPGDKLSDTQMNDVRTLMMCDVDYNCGIPSQDEIKKNVNQVVKDMYILNDMGFKPEEYAKLSPEKRREIVYKLSESSQDHVVFDSVIAPQMYVVYKNQQAYPKYYITFR